MSWTSFFAAPNYPDYTSGANNLSAATTTILEHLFGDKVEFTLFSNAAGAVPRNYTRFSDVARDVAAMTVIVMMCVASAELAKRWFYRRVSL